MISMKQLTLSTTIIVFFVMMIGCGKTKGNKMDEKSSDKSGSTNNDFEKETTVLGKRDFLLKPKLICDKLICR